MASSTKVNPAQAGIVMVVDRDGNVLGTSENPLVTGPGSFITNGKIAAEATTAFPMLYVYGGTITGQTGIWITPPSGTDTSAGVLISPNSGNSNGIGYLSIMSNAVQPATINMATGNGAVPTVGSASSWGPLANGATLSGIYTWGFLAGDHSPFNVASIEVLTRGTWSGAGYSPTSMRFSTTAITNPGTSVRGVHFEIDQNGDTNVENGILITKDAHTSANLPSPAGRSGGRTFITNAATPVFNGSIVGGGTISAPVWCDGTHWRYG